MTTIKLKFKNDVQERIINGDACVFINHEKLLEEGDSFKVGDKIYKVIEIERVLFYDWISYYYKLLGLTSEFKAVEWWKSSYPKEFSKSGEYTGPEDFYLYFFVYIGEVS